tara:strand:- start:7005 stop:8849 length:1845 start_codon:yes stop_codon:yes gene_type:complete
MADINQLKEALVKAHRKGDIKAARLFADKIKLLQQEQPAQPTQPEVIQNEVTPQRETTIADQVSGGLSGAATLASDVIGTGAGGLTALVDILNPFTDNDPVQLIEQVKSKFRIDPSQGGEAALNQLASAIEPAKPLIDAVSQFKETAGQQGLDLTGSPAFATFVNIIPDIIAEVAGGGLIKKGATGRALKPIEEQAKRTAITDIATIDKDTGIATFTSDVIPPETRLGRMMQSQGEMVAGFQRKGQQAQRVKAVENLANQFDVIEGTGFEASIVQGLKDSVQASKQAIGKLYDESTAKLDRLGAVPLANTKRFAQEIIERESKKGTLANQPVIDDMQTLLDAPDDLSFELVKEIRSSVGANLEKVKRGAPVQGNTDTGLLKRVYGRLSGDMKAFAENADPVLADKWKKANSTIEEFATGANKQGAKSIIKSGAATPEVVDTLLFSGKNSDVEFLANNLDEAGKKAAKQRVLQRALDKSSIDGDDINPNKFLKQLNKTRNQIGKMFNPDERRAIFALRDQLTKTRRAQDAKVTTPTGQELVLPAAIVSGGLTLTPGIVQGIIESKPIRNLLIQRKAAKSARAITTIDAQLQSKIDELGLGGALATGAALSTQEQN